MARCDPTIQQTAQAICSDLEKTARLDDTPEVRLSRTLAAAERETREAAGRFVADLPGWLVDRGLWPGKSPDGWVGVELQAALQHLPAPPVTLPTPTLAMPTRSWVIAAAVGALLGMAILTPVSLLLFGQREVGLGMGGALGAAGMVALVGLLARHPAVRSAVATALTVSAAGTFLGGLWSYWRSGTTGWLKGSIGIGGAAFVVLLTKPKLDYSSDDGQLLKLLQAHLRHAADLVLAWGWAHPSRVPAAAPPPQTQQAIPSAVCDTLAELYLLLTADAQPDCVPEMVEVLFQNLQSHGYVWAAVSAGTPFDESMREHYEVLGRPTPGQLVRARRAVLCIGEKVVRKGELRRFEPVDHSSLRNSS